MGYVTRKMSMEDKERVLSDIRKSGNFKFDCYFSLDPDVFMGSDNYIAVDEDTGNYSFSFGESYVSWHFFIFSFGGEVYLMKAELGTKFFSLSYVPEVIRGKFVDELKKIFLSRSFFGLPLDGGCGYSTVDMDEKEIDFDYYKNVSSLTF